MKKVIFLFSAFAWIVSMTSCKKNLDEILFGTWNVTKVEGTLNVNGVSVFTAQDNSPVGTVKFESNGRGRQNYSFTFAGTLYEQVDDFRWEANESEIIIVRTSEPDMIWTRIINTENKQKASYNLVVDANQNWDYTLTLEK
ncbi:MAG: hypothetical protein EP314_05350 [Bacteroidetes bacterium]|nr:MAG: hypothetical protein EP314_05350 [Bacteroidota bacterium]